MNYGELKAVIRDLGFSDDSDIEDFGDVVPSCINRAIAEINQTVTPVIGVYELVQDGKTDDYLYYDMEELTKEGGVTKFIDFADTPVMFGDKTYRKFNDFAIESDKIIVLDGNIKGKFKIFYKKAHERFTVETPDDAKIELPLKAHILIPLLASYYIWLEDERDKAVEYYNQYEKLSQNILSEKQKPRFRIVGRGGY